MRFLHWAIVALFFLPSLVEAGDIRRSKMKDCPIMTRNDPSLVARTFVHPKGDCARDHRTTYAVHDTRIGIVWHMFAPGLSSTGEAVEPDEKDVAESPDFDICTREVPSIGGSKPAVNEWVVPRGRACQRMPESPHYRLYANDRVCLMPAGNCIPVSLLSPKGQERARRVVEQALAD